MMQLGAVPSEQWNTPLRRVKRPGWANASLVHHTHAFTHKPRWFFVIRTSWCWRIPKKLVRETVRYIQKSKSESKGIAVWTELKEFHACPLQQHKSQFLMDLPELPEELGMQNRRTQKGLWCALPALLWLGRRLPQICLERIRVWAQRI